MKNLLCALFLLAIGTLTFSCSNNEDDTPEITCSKEASCLIDGDLLCLTGAGTIDTVPPIDFGGLIVPGYITMNLSLVEFNDNPLNLESQKAITISLVDQNMDGEYDAQNLIYTNINFLTMEQECVANYTTEGIFIDIDILTSTRVSGTFELSSDELETDPLNCIDQITEGQFDITIQ